MLPPVSGRGLRLWGGVVGLSVSLVLGIGCRPSPASKLAKAPEFDAEGQSKCAVQKSPERPLIVEWPSADRLALEAKLRRQAIVVHYDGCDMELLSGCSAPGTYRYTGTNLQEHTTVIREVDELYASIPIYAAKFEGQLATEGQLNVRMAMVGRYETDRHQVQMHELKGDCSEATHIVRGAVAGAFEFYAGADAEVGAGVGALGAETQGTSRATKQDITSAGDREKCTGAATTDTAPPEGCGALIRIEVAPVVFPPGHQREVQAKREDGEPSDGLSPLFWVGAVVAGAGLAVFAISGASAASQTSDLKDACPNDVCPPDQQDNLDSARTAATVSTVSLVFGGVGLGLMGVGLATSDLSGGNSSSRTGFLGQPGALWTW